MSDRKGYTYDGDEFKGMVAVRSMSKQERLKIRIESEYVFGPLRGIGVTCDALGEAASHQGHFPKNGRVVNS